MSRRRAIWWLAIAVGAIALFSYWFAPYARSAAFVVDLAGVTRWWRPLVPIRLQAVKTRNLDVTTRYGPVAGRAYLPERARFSLAVFPGIHAGGVDEPRLVAFSRRLAATGAIVLTVPLPDLRVYRITAASTDIIEDTAAWMAANESLAPDGRVGLIGVSFAGGLALVAAGRPQLQDKLTAVVSLGGHADLPRVMNYLCTGRLPDGAARPPHDYGVVVVLLAALPRLVPAEQVGPLERAILTFLDGSSFAAIDPARSERLFADARAQAQTLPVPAATLMKYVNERDVPALGAELAPHVEALAGAPALSPTRSPATRSPVFLLHGRDDNVIPSSETPFNAAYIEQQGNRQVRWLLTPLVSHADVRPDAPLRDTWQLVRFWTEMLATQKK